MSTRPAPDDHRQGHPSPDRSGGRRLAVTGPSTPPAPAEPAPAAADDAAVDEDAAVELLERVITRIFTAGLLLHTVSGEGHALHGAQPALDELDRALWDIRATVLSQATSSRPRRDDQPTDILGAAIAHLSVASGILSKAAACETARGDGSRWTATNDADLSIHRALIVLLDASPGLAPLRKIRRPADPLPRRIVR